MKTLRNAFHLPVAALLLVAVQCAADEPPATPEPASPFDAWNQSMTERFAKDAECLLRPGVLARRGPDRAVWLTAQWTEISSGEPVEFILIGPKSGHDYEALAVTTATPQDIRDALLFIGVPPGRPVDYPALQLWPRGERVAVSLLVPASLETGALTGAWTAAEQFIAGDETGAALPEKGFVFTGSAPDPDSSPDQPRYSADTGDPYSIISLYNESRSLLDVPRLAPQGPVYGTQSLNADRAQPPGTPLLVRMVPLPPGDGTRSVELDVRAFSVAASNSPEPSFTFSVTDPAGERLLQQAPLPALLALFGTWQEQERDLYITLRPDPEMTVADARRLFAFFEQINTPEGARLSPAGEGELFYKAFLPDLRFAERTQRPNQPWELHLARDAEGRRTGRLDLIEEDWSDEADTPSFRVRSFPANTPDELKKTLQENPDHLKALFIYGELTCGEAQEWYRAIYPDFRTVYFYPAP